MLRTFLLAKICGSQPGHSPQRSQRGKGPTLVAEDRLGVLEAPGDGRGGRHGDMRGAHSRRRAGLDKLSPKQW